MAGRIRFVTGLAFTVSLAAACDKGHVTEATQPLAISCAATPASGMAPLTVAFGLNVANARGSFAVTISYGDGTQQGSDPDVRHVYDHSGDFVASITVTAGADTARCSVPIAVAAAPAPSPSPAPKLPNPPGNQPPVASFIVVPEGSTITGKAPFSVSLNLCRSADPDGDRLLFRMDLDGNGSFEFLGSSGADCRHTASYAVGTRTATICVTDVECPSWPLCNDYLPLHPYQCRSYTVIAVP